VGVVRGGKKFGQKKKNRSGKEDHTNHIPDPRGYGKGFGRKKDSTEKSEATTQRRDIRLNERKG